MKKSIRGMVAALTALTLVIALAGCTTKTVTAEEAQQVNWGEYWGWLGDEYVFEIEEFLRDCGASNILVHNGWRKVTGEINGRQFAIVTDIRTNEEDGRQYIISQFQLAINGDDDHYYIVGWLPNDEITSSGNTVNLIEAKFGPEPDFYRRRVLCGETFLRQVITIMTSGVLLGDSPDPLADLHIPYVKMSKYGTWEEFGA